MCGHYTVTSDATHDRT